MDHYRIFILDGFGHVVRHDAFDCASDDEALAGADIARGASAAEVWRGGRFVARLSETLSSRPAATAPSALSGEAPDPERPDHPDR